MKTKAYIKRHFGKEASVLPALGAGVIGMLIVRHWLNRGSDDVVDATKRPDVVDEASQESFPASDPPAW